jgi:hypothetical protein
MTPLAHVDHDREGRVDDLHVLNWIHGQDYDMLFPLAWATGRAGHRHYGIVPAWFQGERWWCAPPLLSGGATSGDGSCSLWLTPLAHVDHDRSGAIDDMHVLNWFHGRDYDVLFPLAWATGRAGHRHYGIVPAWFQGERWWCAPPLLSGGATSGDGSRSLWLTPLAHIDHDRSGAIDDMHVLNWLHGRDYDVLFPLAWATGRAENRHYGILPVWLQGERWWCAPPLLSGGVKRADGSRSLWVTPLAHADHDREGAVRDAHVLTYFHGRGYDVLFPLAWATGRAGQRHYGVIPAWFQGERWWCAPPLLSGGLSHRNGGRSTWVTPLFHRRTAADGSLLHEHLLTYVATPSFETAFPLYWSWRSKSGDRRSLMLPVYYRCAGGDGDATTTVGPALFSYHSGQRLNTSLGYQLIPFVVQHAADGREVNVLWRLMHERRTAGVSESMVAPLWWSERRDGAPSRWQILGGLLARNCNYQTGHYRYYALWLIPLGGQGHFKPSAATPSVATAAL